MLKNAKKLIKSRLGQVLRDRRHPARQIPAEYWGMELTSDSARFAGRDLRELVQQYGSPLHVFDPARLQANYQALDGLELFYSYKTHPLPAVLQRLHGLGAGAEVISEMELNLALRLGVAPDRIIYNGPAKSTASLKTAIENNLLLLNLNHAEELQRVAAVARELGKKPAVGIRVNVPGGWSSQFGTPIESGAALTLLEQALACKDIRLVGLHSHRGELIHSSDQLRAFLSAVLGFADEVRRRFDWRPQILDLGGSLGVRSVSFPSAFEARLARTFGVEPPAPDPTSRLGLTEYAAILRQTVEQHYKDVGEATPRTVIELGRALTADTQCLVATVVEARTGADNIRYAIMDAGINLASICSVARHQIFAVAANAASPACVHRLVGPICQPGDVVRYAIELPPLEAGDLVLIMDSGAYFEPDSTVFSFPRPGTLMIENDQARWIRLPETLDDITRRDCDVLWRAQKEAASATVAEVST